MDGTRGAAMIDPECIPQQLRDRPQWVCWHDENGSKIPYAVASGRRASSTDPGTWATFDDACSAAARRGYSGIGYVFADDDPFTGIDLDDCIDDAGELQPWARRIVDTMQTYAEISPSGRGVKLWVIGAVPESVKTRQIEIYSRARYFTVTGRRLPGTPAAIGDAAGELAALYASLRPARQPRPAGPLPRPAADSDYIRRWCLAALEGEQAKMLAAGEGERHNRRFDSAHALAGLVHTGGLHEDEIAAALAVNFGASEAGARRTIADGIKHGKHHPRTIPAPGLHQPAFDAAGHACCPTHDRRLIACRNGNGWRCPTPEPGVTNLSTWN